MPGWPPQLVGEGSEGFHCTKQRKEVKVNLVQLKMDWVSLPNIRNGTYIGTVFLKLIGLSPIAKMCYNYLLMMTR